MTYTHKKVRGDVVEWYDGSEKFLEKNGSLNDHLQKCDTFVSELGNHINGLDGVLNRSKAMVTCYPEMVHDISNTRIIIVNLEMVIHVMVGD